MQDLRGAKAQLGARAMSGWVQAVDALRARAGAQRFIVVLRIFLGFALLPSGLKKVLGEPFTDAASVGPFHDFLRAFYATGFFYTFVGLCQMLTAFLLMTQRWASLGAVLMAPIITVILVFCWSTHVYPTASVVTLMFLGTLFLLLWDHHSWRGLFTREAAPSAPPAPSPPPAVSRRYGLCGLAIYVLYLLSCVVYGGVYRPRGLELHEPAFYVLPGLLVLLLATYVKDRASAD
jgi:uncharacterized membrane protein YphA (DoxX/SURF4 family)